MSQYTLKQLADQIAVELGVITGKTHAVKMHDGINLSTELPNNPDGVGRYVVPGSMTIKRVGAKTIQIDRKYLVIYAGTTAEDATVIALQNEIETVMKSIINVGGPTKSLGWPCITATTLPGSDAGYSLDELTEGKIAAGLELLFTRVE